MSILSHLQRLKLSLFEKVILANSVMLICRGISGSVGHQSQS